ncbi:aldehyde dehydrogenase (NADP(+)) [Agromyces sp. NPDC058104]|uniref:aldehyde dehydrogenase (NADP(+)) n=1 Tax=Agromyces sp. NPDC058104 TaxID=3346342 RepID=UPI0036DA3B4E
MLRTTDPRTAVTADTGLEPTDPAGVARAVDAAATAFEVQRWSSRDERAALLEALADGLEDDRELLVSTADRETGLGTARLNGELSRAAFQFRLFAEAVREGGYLEATIDHAGETPIGPGPEIRRMLVPIGPVAVFGSSNFPFAFSVAGGDTASAIAGGNTVVLKAHSSHLLTSQRSFEALSRAARAAGAPEGLLGIVYGTQSGRDLVADPRITAVGFTGSLGAGQALIDLINRREQPIPFYGELSSVNPLIVTPGAAEARAEEIAAGLFGSFTLGAGQFCTKPGIAFVPRGAGDEIVEGLVRRAAEASGQVLLNERIASSFTEIRDRLVDDGGAQPAAAGTVADDATGFEAAPTVLTIDAAAFTPALAEEAFGPLVVVARYDSVDEVVAALAAVPDSLTATVHGEPEESELVASLTRRLVPLAGRIVYNGYPTGVRVSWAQHHGGGWPATNSQHTSVGVSAIRRFLRPVAFQDAPEGVLPVELHEGYTGVPRRVDGVLELPA